MALPLRNSLPDLTWTTQSSSSSSTGVSLLPLPLELPRQPRQATEPLPTDLPPDHFYRKRTKTCREQPATLPTFQKVMEPVLVKHKKMAAGLCLFLCIVNSKLSELAESELVLGADLFSELGLTCPFVKYLACRRLFLSPTDQGHFCLKHIGWGAMSWAAKLGAEPSDQNPDSTCCAPKRGVSKSFVHLLLCFVCILLRAGEGLHFFPTFHSS